MLFSELVQASALIAATPARRGKLAHLADLLRRLSPDEIEVAVAFLSGGPRQTRIGLGPAAVRQARDRPPADQPSLTLLEVERSFEDMARLAGPGSNTARVALLGALLEHATAEEQSFLVRLIFGELRQGALAGLLAEGLARAADIPPSAVHRALTVAGDLPAVARIALTAGAAGLSGLRPVLFQPLQPMLAQPAADLADALARLGEAALELKLDGARVQVHRQGSDVRVYSRGLNDVTAAVPELVRAVAALPARELILDGEVLALAPDGAPRPFQITMRRFGRRLDVARAEGELPLTPYFFDLLHLDGTDLVDRPLRERFAALAAIAGPLVVPQIVTSDPGVAAEFYDAALRRGHEGVMAKALAAPYEAGGRGSSWLKIKSAHTLDLVVLAAEWGHGRRSGLLSNLHLGARDAESEQFVMLGKTFKGLTDAMLAWQTERLQQLATDRDALTVYVRPELVVEITFNNVQASPHYPAGLALRLARVKRYREDKPAAEADTLQAVRAIFDHERGAG